jgi:hypothetical protein
MLLRRVAAVHSALGAALGVTHLVLIVAFGSFVMMFCAGLMIAGSFFVENAGFIGK